MAEKKAKPPVKAAAKKVAPKVVARRKVAAKKSVAGDSLACGVCGLVVTVDEACGCVDVCEIICCGEPMKAEPVKVKASRK